MDTELPTVAIQATTEWEAVVALVYLQEDGLEVHLPVKVTTTMLCIYTAYILNCIP